MCSSEHGKDQPLAAGVPLEVEASELAEASGYVVLIVESASALQRLIDRMHDFRGGWV